MIQRLISHCHSIDVTDYGIVQFSKGSKKIKHCEGSSMAVTVNDALTLAPFKEARILAGANGLDNVIKGVSISDNPSSEIDHAFSFDGYFFLSSFYFAGKSTSDMYEFLQTSLRTGGSGLCLIDAYVSGIPDEIRDFCDQSRFPVIMVDKYVPYADMISGIMQLIIFDQQTIVMENKITALASGHLDEWQKAKMIQEINPQFKSHVTVIYGKPPNRSAKSNAAILSTINRNPYMSALEYKGGLLLIISYAITKTQSPQEKIDYVIETISGYYDDCVIGVSRTNNLLDCGTAINQAITAVNSKNIKKSQTIFYDNLGIVRLLELFHGHGELESFYNDILGPILEFDKKSNQPNLLETMICFIENGRDYRKTSKDLFLHENTIRYRVTKVQELIGTKCSSSDFLEELSIAIKIYRLRQAENQGG
ncbi:UNVERIFIED_CONTAM: hypothetical protein ABID98_005145 [Brevibacillus sp. OAP136]